MTRRFERDREFLLRVESVDNVSRGVRLTSRVLLTDAPAAIGDRREWFAGKSGHVAADYATQANLKALFLAARAVHQHQPHDAMVKQIAAMLSSGNALRGKVVALRTPTVTTRLGNSFQKTVWRTPTEVMMTMFSPLAGKLWRDVLAGVDGAGEVLDDYVLSVLP